MLDPHDADRAQPSRGFILHVEDDYDTRLGMSGLLTLEGFEYQGAASPETALAEAVSWKHRVDVLMIDYHLGASMTGTEVAEAIGRLLGPGLPTVLLTGDPANAEVPLLRNSPVWLASKPLCTMTLVAGLTPLVAFRRALQRLTAP
jgi:CheY-like chemotaxis protein